MKEQGPPILELTGVSLRYSGAPRDAVDSCDLKVRAGETLALVGRSGSGKSSLARAALLLEPAMRGRVVLDGETLVDSTTGQTPTRAAERRLRRRVQIVLQDPRASLDPRMRAGALIGEGLEIHDLARGREKDEKVAELMARVGLDPDAASRFPHEFSGGQRQRIALARVLAVEPALVVLDEPTSALDVAAQARIVTLLQELSRDLGVAWWLVAHDPGLVRRMADRVAVMQSGRIVESAPTEELYEAPEHPYTKAWLAAARQGPDSNSP